MVSVLLNNTLSIRDGDPIARCCSVWKCMYKFPMTVHGESVFTFETMNTKLFKLNF